MKKTVLFSAEARIPIRSIFPSFENAVVFFLYKEFVMNLEREREMERRENI